MSPKTIISGETLDYKKHLSLQIGQYCQVHKENTPRNSQSPRTMGAISLGSSGNLQGGFKFMSLATSKKIIRRSWDVIPTPDTVIARVNALGADQPQQMIFTDQHGRPIGDVEIPGVDYEEEEADETELPEIMHQPGADDIELPGVDVPGLGNKNPDPQIVEIDDLDMLPPDPDLIELEVVVTPPLAAPPEPEAPPPIVQQPVDAPQVRRSTRVRQDPTKRVRAKYARIKIFLCRYSVGIPRST